jgi:hypothetical protein
MYGRLRGSNARWFVYEPKIPIWLNFGGSCNENIGMFYDHLVYFTAIGNMLWQFGIFCGHLVYFSPYWYFVPRKIWQPCCVAQRNKKMKYQKIRELGNTTLKLS